MSLGVLAMAYGTPAGPDALEAFYTDIRHGRPPSAELLEELRSRYAAIGGGSPLLQTTRDQAAGLEAALNADGETVTHVAIGMKHAEPSIGEGLDALMDAGVERIIGLVLAPHYSRMSVGDYARRAEEALAALPGAPPLTMIDSWHLEPSFIALLAAGVSDALASLPAERRDDAHVLFTAHSLPLRALADGDPYPEQLHQTAQAVAEQAGLAHWSVGWQSAGRTPDPWIGPDVLELLAQLAQNGTRAVVVCPAGFVADHLETLYDLDIEARDRAQALGLAFARTPAPNATPEFAAALADVVRHALAREVAR